MLNLIIIIVIIFFITLLFLIVKVVYEQRRSYLSILFALLVVLPAILFIGILCSPLILMRGILNFILEKIENRESSSNYKHLLHRIHESNLKLLDYLMRKPIYSIIDVYKHLADTSTKTEQQESISRSLKILKKNGHKIDIEASWDSTLPKNKVALNVFRKGTHPREKKTYLDLREGLEHLIKKRFIELNGSNENEKILWNKGKGTVFYNSGRIEFLFENTMNLEFFNRVKKIPLEKKHPFFGSKEDRRSKLNIYAEYDYLKAEINKFELSFLIEYGDEFMFPEWETELMKSNIQQQLHAAIKTEISPGTALLNMNEVTLYVSKVDESEYLLTIFLSYVIEINERKMETLYE